MKDEVNARVKRISGIYRDFLVRLLPLRKRQNDILDSFERRMNARERASIESRIKQSS